MVDKQWFCVNCASLAGDSNGTTTLDAQGRCSKCNSDAVIAVATAIHTLRAQAPSAVQQATVADVTKPQQHRRRFDNIDMLVSVTEASILQARKAGYGIDKQMLALAPDIWNWWDGFGLTYYFGLENLLESPTTLTMEFENQDGNTKILKLEPSFKRIAIAVPQVIDNAQVAAKPDENKP